MKKPIDEKVSRKEFKNEVARVSIGAPRQGGLRGTLSVLWEIFCLKLALDLFADFWDSRSSHVFESGTHKSIPIFLFSPLLIDIADLCSRFC